MSQANKLAPLLPFFQTMSDATRLRLVGLLAHGPRSVEQLATELLLSPSTVSHHLKRLSALELVAAHVDGHYHVYRLRQERLDELSDLLRQATQPNDAPPPAESRRSV
jgi:DNA-binding transcriptional ArsR family regulator